jgi:hypothetical protein
MDCCGIELIVSMQIVLNAVSQEHERRTTNTQSWPMYPAAKANAAQGWSARRRPYTAMTLDRPKTNQVALHFDG